VGGGRRHRGEQLEGLPDLDPIRQGRFLELAADAFPELSDLGSGVEIENLKVP